MSDENSDDEETSQPEMKVTDRRQFTADGERIPSDSVGGEPPAPEEPTPGEKPEAHEEVPQGASFDDLVMGLVGTTLMHLGEMPDASGSTPNLNLAGAREAIDLLGILKEKTAGNLAAEEQQFLDHWLSSLRMLFSQKA